MRDPDAGSAGSILDLGTALAGRGHTVEYLWSAGRPYWMPHPFLSRWLELPRRQFNQIAAELARAPYDVVIIIQPYAYLVYERLAKKYPNTLFLNGTYGWEDLLHRTRLRFEWDGPFTGIHRRAILVTKALINRACRRTARACHGILTPTHYSAKYLVEQYDIEPEKIAVVPTGLGDRFLKSTVARVESPAPRMLYVGNYLPLKGARVLEKILPGLAKAHPTATMTFVVQKRAVARVRVMFGPAFGDRLKIVPWRDRETMPDLYAQHDIQIFPSFFEGFGRVFLEAMSRGVCVVGFGVGGVPDLTVSGRDAFYCETGDVEALRVLVDRCLRDPALTHAVGERGRLTALAYSTQSNAEQVEAFCEQRRAAIGSPRASRG